MAVTETTHYVDDYKVHVFTGSGSALGVFPIDTSVEIFVVGGGSGSNHPGVLGGGVIPTTSYPYGQAGKTAEETKVYTKSSGIGENNFVIQVGAGSANVPGGASVAGGNSYVEFQLFPAYFPEWFVEAAGGIADTFRDKFSAEEGAGQSGTKWGYELDNVGGGGKSSSYNGRDGIVMVKYHYPLVLTITEIKNITSTGFTVDGVVTKGEATTLGVCYFEGESGNPDAEFDSIESTTGSFSDLDTFSITVTGLTAGESYRFRLFGISPYGTVYGTTVQICTLNGAGTDGTTTWTEVPYFTFTNAEFRGGIVADDMLFCVMGDRVVYTTAARFTGYCGQITTTTGFVSMASNGTHVLIVDGTDKGFYIDIAAKTLHSITSVDFPYASSCAFMDGYFVVTKKDSGEFYLSGFYAVDDWDASRYATAEGSPDNVVRCLNANNTLWLFGEDSIEVWYNTGDVEFLFSRIQGAVIDDGLAAVAGIVLIKDQIYFLSTKKEVLRTVGYRREKISTLHIETAISQYSTVSDAIAYEYRLDGHTFLVLTFPTANVTWVYDTTTGHWHEWQSFVTAGASAVGRHRGAYGFFLGGKWLLVDHSSSDFYELDPLSYTDNGEAIKRIRRAQTITKDKKLIAHNAIALEFEYLDNIEYTTTPQVFLRYSDDNGITWSNYKAVNMPITSRQVARQIWRRLGIARNRIYEIMCSSNCKFVLAGASAELEGHTE